MTREEGIRVPKRPFWTGNITIGLVNVPVKLYAMIFDKGISFRLMHKIDGQPLKYDRICLKENKTVPWEDIAKGYEISKGKFIVFNKEELKAVSPESDKKIRIDKFVDFLSTDPIYFEKSYILVPDKSNDAYSLLLTALDRMGKAGAGKISLRTKEYPVLIHPYKGALVLTAMRYSNEVIDPNIFDELRDLKQPKKEELELAMKIIADLSGEFDIKEYKDLYRQRVEDLIKKKLKREVIVFEEPVKEEAKELMAALQETLQKLKR
jgi:DNA end-binding protein Ku